MSIIYNFSLTSNAIVASAIEAAIASGVTATASRATMSTINNQGRLDKVGRDLTSKEAMTSLGKGMLTSSIAAGLTSAAGYGDLSQMSGGKLYGGMAARSFIDESVSAAIENRSFKAGNVVANTALAAAQNKVGDIAAGGHKAGDGAVSNRLKDGSLGKALMHASVGGAFAEATGGSFKYGAIAGGASELASPMIPTISQNPATQKAITGLISATTNFAIGGGASDITKGQKIAESMSEYNHGMEHLATPALATIAPEASIALGPVGIMVGAKAVEGKIKDKVETVALRAAIDALGWAVGPLKDSSTIKTSPITNNRVVYNEKQQGSSGTGNKDPGTSGKKAPTPGPSGGGSGSGPGLGKAAVAGAVVEKGRQGLGKTAKQVVKENPYITRRYLKEVEDITGNKVHPKQIKLLKEDLKKNEYSKLNDLEQRAHRIEFNSKKDVLRKEWEINTRQKWPVYEKQTLNSKGVIETKDYKYDAHHMNPVSHGGHNEWWNIHPALPKEHQHIHGTGSVIRQIIDGVSKK